jgi:Icc-related predicted phosphoesterase
MAYLDAEIATPFGGPTVVVTHHAPLRRSISDVYAREPSSAAFASNLDDRLKGWKPQLWVHGHVHHSLDYRIAETRVLCNPRGYAGKPNPAFEPGFVVEV